MDLGDLILLLYLPFMFGPVIFMTDTIFPVLSLLFGLGAFREKGSKWGIFFGFLASFAFFRIVITLLVKVSEISFATLQYFGFFFLVLMGLMMLIPLFSFWNKFENAFSKALSTVPY